MIPTHNLRKSMYIPASKKELVVLKNECFVSQPMVNPQSRNVAQGHRATLSSIILSKQLLLSKYLTILHRFLKILCQTQVNQELNEQLIQV